MFFLALVVVNRRFQWRWVQICVISVRPIERMKLLGVYIAKVIDIVYHALPSGMTFLIQSIFRYLSWLQVIIGVTIINFVQNFN